MPIGSIVSLFNLYHFPSLCLYFTLDREQVCCGKWCSSHLGVLFWAGEWLVGQQTYQEASAFHSYQVSEATHGYVDGLAQERRNSSALTMELRLSYTNPSKCDYCNITVNHWGLNKIVILQALKGLNWVQISLKFVPTGPINNKSALAWVMA